MSIHYGIRASSPDGGNISITLLGKDNHVARSCRVETALVVAEFWDLASGQRVKPFISAAIRNATDTDNANQASIDAAIKYLKAYIKASAAAASLLVSPISDAQMHHVRSVIKDPIATWLKLQEK